MLLMRTVFGYSPRPHSLNDPKSLYQSPSGANGSDLTQVCKRRRSGSGMWRSSTRARRCCQSSRGRSEKRIFGNSRLPENRAYEILSSLLFFFGFLLFQEFAVGDLQVVFGFLLGLDASFRQGDQGAADREVTLFCDASHFCRQWRGNGDALTHTPASALAGRKLVHRGHLSSLPRMHHCGSPGQQNPFAFAPTACLVDPAVIP